MAEKYDPIFASLRAHKGHLTRAENEFQKYLNFAQENPTNPGILKFVEEAEERVSTRIDTITTELDHLSPQVSNDDELSEDECTNLLNKIINDLNELTDRRAQIRLLYLQTMEDVQVARRPTSPPIPAQGGPINQCKPMDALRPDKLTKDTAPVNFKLWCNKFRAYYDASRFELLSEETQHAYVYALVDEYLTQVLREKLAHDTPIFGPADSVMAYLKEVFDRLYTTFSRRMQFFRLPHNNKQKLSEYIVNLKALALEADLASLGPEQLIVFRILTACADKSLNEKLFRLDEPSLQDIENEVQKFERVQSAFLSMGDSVRASQLKSKNDKRNVKKGQARTTTEKMKNKCWHCAKDLTNHRFKSCPMKEKSCNNCGKKGHISPACLGSDFYSKRNKSRSSSRTVSRSNSRSSSPNNTTSNTVSENNTVSTACISAIKQDVKSSSSAQYGGKPTPLIKIAVRPADLKKKFAHTVSAMPDCGASRTIVPSKLVTRLGWKCNTLHIEEMLAANKTNLKCDGQIHLIFNYMGEETKIDALISPDIDEILISWYDLMDMGILPRNFPLKIAAATAASSFGSTLLSTDQYREMFPDVLNDHLHTAKGMDCPPLSLSLRDDPSIQPCRITTPRKVPMQLEEAAKVFLDTAVSDGVLTPVSEPTEWINPSMFLPKKDGKKVRLVVDLRQLNKLVRRPIHPFPCAREIMQSVQPTSTHFAKLDMLHGYHQIRLDHEASLKTTFLTKWGAYRYLRIPQGLSSSGDYFTKVGDLALSGLQGVSKIIDDILIQGDSADQLHQRILEVLKRCQQYNIILSPSKFQISTHNLPFAGFLVGRDGVRPDKNKLDAIKQFPKPTNVSDVRSFLGMINQMSLFVPNLSPATTHLRQLLQKNNAFFWSDDHQKEFDALKDMFTSELLVKHFDPNLKTSLLTDASRLGIGYALLQHNKEGKTHLIQCGSRSLTIAEKNYAVVELEMLALTYGMKQCHYYLIGTDFTVLTDHRALVGLFNKHLPDIENPRLLRLRMKTAEFSFNVHWTEGKTHYLADALSRHPIDVPEDDSDGVSVCSLLLSAVVSDPALANLFQAAENDQGYQSAVQAFKNQEDVKILPSNHYAKQFANIWRYLSTYGPLLIYQGHRIVVPSKERPNILRLLHLPHAGLTKTKEAARQLYYWPGLTNDITQYIQNCAKCQEFLPSQQAEPLKESKSSYPMDLVGIDLFQLRNRHYLAMIDHFSGFLWCALMPRQRSCDIISQLQDWFYEFGYPARIRHDGAQNLVSFEISEFFNKHYIKDETTSAYFPQSNGVSEISVKMLKHLLDKYDGNMKSFKPALHEFRLTPRADGFSPAQLFFGRRPRGQLPTLPQSFLPEDHVGRNRSFAKHHDLHAKPLPPLQVDSTVLVQNPHTLRWDSTATVIEIRDHGRSYVIKDDFGATFLRNRHFLRPKIADRGDGDEKCDVKNDKDDTHSILRRSDRISKKKSVSFDC